MNVSYTCVSHDHDPVRLKVVKIHAFTQRSCSVVFVVNYSGVQPATQAEILGVHLPYFPYRVIPAMLKSFHSLAVMKRCLNYLLQLIAQVGKFVMHTEVIWVCTWHLSIIKNVNF